MPVALDGQARHGQDGQTFARQVGGQGVLRHDGQAQPGGYGVLNSLVTAQRHAQARGDVVRAGQSTTAYAFPAVSAISGTNASGSLISGLLASESAIPIAVVFAESGAPRVTPATVQYHNIGAADIKNYVAKLKPNMLYAVTSTTAAGVVSVTVTESTSGIKADAVGVLTFSL
jgi:hypothetical protein